jgi:hypothetical protein
MDWQKGASDENLIKSKKRKHRKKKRKRKRPNKSVPGEMVFSSKCCAKTHQYIKPYILQIAIRKFRVLKY